MKLLELFTKLNEQPHPSQLVNVDTPQFRSWFGGSKAVDDEGHPIVFFRGTAKSPARNVAFATKRSIPSFVAAADIASVYAASYPKTGFGPAFGEEPPPPTFQPGAQVSPVFLSIKNPVDMRGIEHLDFEMGLFGLLKSDWSDWNAMQLALDIMYDLAVLENKGVQFEYNLPDPPGGIEQGTWMNVREWLEEAFDEAQDEQWSGHAAELFTSVLAEVEVDAYAVVDTPSFKEWAEGMGFDGVVHDDIFAQGAKFSQSLLGKGRPNGLDEEDMHVTWRPFEAVQVKSIFNQGGWSTEHGSSMTESLQGAVSFWMHGRDIHEFPYRNTHYVAAKTMLGAPDAGEHETQENLMRQGWVKGNWVPAWDQLFLMGGDEPTVRQSYQDFMTKGYAKQQPTDLIMVGVFDDFELESTSGSPMTDAEGDVSIQDLEPAEQQEVMTQVFHSVRSVASKYKASSPIAAELYHEFLEGTDDAAGIKFTPGGRSDPDKVIGEWEAAGAPLLNTPELEAWLLQYATGRIREAAYLHVHKDGRRVVNDEEEMGDEWESRKLRDD